MKIKNIILREIFDSRAEPTLEICLESEKDRMAVTQVPAGRSLGRNEAAVFKYFEAERVLEQILKKEIIGKNFKDVEELDKFLIQLDGTENKSILGGNLTLGISIAFLRLSAIEKNKEPWEVLREEFFSNGTLEKKPTIFSNLINGGAHADNNLAIQEYLAVVRPGESITYSVKKLIKLYKNLEQTLKDKFGVDRLSIGDEAGYSLDFENNFEPIGILEKLIRETDLEGEVVLGLDVAASIFAKDGLYEFDKRQIASDELLEVYLKYFDDSKLLWSVEDPFGENDFEKFKELKERLKDKLVIGDDLTVTNPKLISHFAKTINGVIIKPNQIGTITETCEAIKTAQKNDFKIIVSHRSGETEDNFIIHLAKASGADGVKIGAPARERIYKFNELIRVYGD